MNEHEKALECFCEFLDNHFVLDDDFTRAVEGKAFALEALSKDSSCERDILSQLDPAS